MAASPAPEAAPLPADIATMKRDELTSLAARHGLPIPSGWKVGELRNHLVEKLGAETPAPALAIVQGEVEAPAPAVKVDSDGFPEDREDVAKLDDDNLDRLVNFIENQDDIVHPPFTDRDAKVQWIQRLGYEVAGQTSIIDDDGGITELFHGGDTPAHIPTASPEPRTEIVPTLTEDELRASEGLAKPEDGAPEDPAPAQDTTSVVDAIGQLTFDVGGEAPEKAVLNAPALRVDLGSRQEFMRGDIVTVTFDIEIEKLAFLPEKVGKHGKRVVRTHGGRIDQDTVKVTLAS